jgi:hypothetical protein
MYKIYSLQFKCTEIASLHAVCVAVVKPVTGGTTFTVIV